MAEQKPSAGRIVHYVSYGTPGGEYQSECRAAIITEGSDALDGEGVETIGLCVFNPTGLFFNDCQHDEDEKRGGSWHWPERT